MIIVCFRLKYTCLQTNPESKQINLSETFYNWFQSRPPPLDSPCMGDPPGPSKANWSRPLEHENICNAELRGWGGYLSSWSLRNVHLPSIPLQNCTTPHLPSPTPTSISTKSSHSKHTLYLLILFTNDYIFTWQIERKLNICKLWLVRAS